MTSTPPSAIPNATSRADRRIALLCAAASLLILLACWPFAPTSFNDDWSYAFTVKQLLTTGHFRYNGWATAAIIGQVYWGWLWTAILGFSFDVLRLSTFPLAGGAVALCYLLARHAGLNRSHAVFTALLLGLSPVFMPYAASFMTDVPGLFFILLSLYTLVRSAESDRTPAILAWLILGLLAGMIGGTSRQVVWIVPLAVVPYLTCLRRRHRPFVVAATLGWFLLVAVILYTMRWFAKQPFALPEPSMLVDLKHAYQKPGDFFTTLLELILTIVLLTLPAAECTMNRWRGRRSALALILFVACVLALRHRPPWSVEPWIGNTLDPRGILAHYELGGGSPVKMLSDPIRETASAVVYAVVAFILSLVIFKLASPRRFFDQLKKFVSRPEPGQVALPAMTLFALAYTALLLPRMAQGNVYDRYALPLIPCQAIPLLLLGQRHRSRPSIPAWVALGLFTVYGIGITQELFSLGRAREIAANQLVSAGVPRTMIGGGLEYDSWTELETTGHINSARLVNPPNVYRPGLGLSPSVRPIYRLQFQPTTDDMPTPFGSVDYTTLWPPFNRKVWIVRVRQATP